MLFAAYITSLLHCAQKMQFLLTFVIAGALLASGLAAPPGLASDRYPTLLNARADRPKTPENKDSKLNSPPAPKQAGSFDLDGTIGKWLGEAITQKRIRYADTTDGGWEGWAQFEIEVAFRDALEYDYNKGVREVKVFLGSNQAADFTFDPSEQKNKRGMIVELKCENKKTYSGTKVVTAFEDDIKKLKGNFKAQYEDYDKVAIVMAYSAEAQAKLDKMAGGEVDYITIPSVTVGNAATQRKLKIYRMDVDSPVKKVTDSMGNLGIGDQTSPTAGKGGKGA